MAHSIKSVSVESSQNVGLGAEALYFYTFYGTVVSNNTTA